MYLNSCIPPGELSRSISQCVAVGRLIQLQAESRGSPLRSFGTWVDVRRWLDEIDARSPSADTILRPVLVKVNRLPDEIWHDIMLFLFWRPLVLCRGYLKRLDEKEPDALDSYILWAFIRVLHNLNLDVRQVRLGQKILNDVQYDVRLFYKTDRELTAKFRQLLTQENTEDDGERGFPAPPIEDGAFAAVEHRHDSDWACARLDALVRQGRISETDYLILLGCYLYEEPLKEIAERLGLTYDAARKRRQRVAKYFRENARKMSPDTGLNPLRKIAGRKSGRRRHE